MPFMIALSDPTVVVWEGDIPDIVGDVLEIDARELR